MVIGVTSLTGSATRVEATGVFGRVGVKRTPTLGAELAGASGLKSAGSGGGGAATAIVGAVFGTVMGATDSVFATVSAGAGAGLVVELQTREEIFPLV